MLKNMLLTTTVENIKTRAVNTISWAAVFYLQKKIEIGR